MICNRCGNPCPDNTHFCTKCGNDLTIGRVQQSPASYEWTDTPQPSASSGWSQQLRESKYDGSVFETFIAFLIASIIGGITFGIAVPWATCYLYRFILSHTIIDGKRLTFDGTGGQLFGNWIKWFVFIVITCGIYGFWVYPRMFDWMAKHTHFAE